MSTGSSGTGAGTDTGGSGTDPQGSTATGGTVDPGDADWDTSSSPGALSALRYRRGSLSILDQRLLPAEVRYEPARPTGSNMAREAQRLREVLRGRLAESPPPGEAQLRESIIEHVEGLLRRDVEQNRSIGAHGARHILERVPPGSAVTLLTHCNTGALATAGYGTALGIVWALHAQGRVARVFCTETRPYNQGARLTALELLHAGVPATLITDSAAAAAMRDRGVQAVVVGADRVAANGDTANKIGTYALALAARHHGVPLYVAAPSASCDPALPRGDLLPLEERPAHELGAAPGIEVWNPAFDVTPHELITGGIVTEWGVLAPGELRAALAAHGAL